MAMTLRLNDDDNAKLREVAQREGRSMHEIAVAALRQYFARQEEFRADQVRRFLAEDAELLELLSR
ncbi:ribbon-helix-helix protein, CopG family [Saccharopolyspora phatthalungensis]|uniref:Putative transcriptional regulator n=1 Tax=Saccharopolyspora phatthalungensis TaxID=664693 RepID=A0A840QB79_9PSEU|nr:ribbon-helix-helix protein, CopG family [Saccharopolyspora phatthalungensis]MBB5155809.1 putative transcriptional regulator [Saccharopolyspora phatthalungensis]